MSDMMNKLELAESISNAAQVNVTLTPVQFAFLMDRARNYDSQWLAKDIALRRVEELLRVLDSTTEPCCPMCGEPYAGNCGPCSVGLENG